MIDDCLFCVSQEVSYLERQGVQDENGIKGGLCPKCGSNRQRVWLAHYPKNYKVIRERLFPSIFKISKAAEL